MCKLPGRSVRDAAWAQVVAGLCEGWAGPSTPGALARLGLMGSACLLPWAFAL